MSSEPPKQPVALIYNPMAGDGRWRPSIDEVRRALEHAGGVVEMLPTRGPGDGVALARQAAGRYARIAVYGGDGSVNEVLNGVAGVEHAKRPQILLLPGGTMNVLCRDLGIPLDPVAAAMLLKTGVSKRIYLGLAANATIGKRYFALMAGAGLDAAVVHGMSGFTAIKRLLGGASFLLAGLKIVVSHGFPEIEVTVEDGAQAGIYRGCEVVVGKSCGYGGFFSITDQADACMPKFEVMVGRRIGGFAHIFRLARAFFGRLKHSRSHAFAIATRLRMASNERALVQMDGEPVGELPMEFSIDGTSVELLVPALAQ
jgi:diacylglycerol kinase (ATP)